MRNLIRRLFGHRSPEMDGGIYNLLTQAVQQIEGLRAHCAAKYPDVHRYREGDYELGLHVVGLLHWSDHAKERLAAVAPPPETET